MAHVLRHLALLGVTLPAGLLGYHVLAGAGAGLSADLPPSERIADFVTGVTGRSPRLADLQLLERNLYYVEQRYVEQDRIDPEAMFSAALDRVERRVAGVMFVRRPGGKHLQVSVGPHTTSVVVPVLDDFDALYTQLRRVAAILDTHLPSDVDRAEVEYDLVNGALSTLDPHSILLPPVAAREMETDNAGEFGGLGIEIHIRDGLLTVKQPLEGTPAEAAGMRAGDQIIRIEDESTINMELTDAVSRLRGEVGSPVEILVKRKGRDKPLPVRIVRDRIKVNPVEGRLLDGNVGYARIKAFHGNVAADLETLLARLQRESRGDLGGLVLDLRGNPGGYLNQAVAVSDFFVDEGVIVSTVEGSGHREEERATKASTQTDYPMVVLVDGSSASASEIVAGALKNLGRAAVVGERTFGKGSVQHLYPNRDDSTLKLTVAKYLTPGDHSIQAVGIPADLALHPSVVRPGDSADEPDLVSLYWREWIDREADLDHALGWGVETGEKPVFDLRFLRPRPAEDDAPRRTFDDWEVAFARDVLVAASGPKRVDVLKAAGPVVQAHRTTQEAAIQAAFSDLGVDWSPGANPEHPTVEISLDLGEDGRLAAGDSETVHLAVTNTGDQDLWQISAVTHSENAWLDDREFYFGHIPAGQTATAEQVVSLHPGYVDEDTEVEVVLRDPTRSDLATRTDRVVSQAQLLPSFAYSVALVDDGSHGSDGDGDGIPEAGEVVSLVTVVENTGGGEARDGFVRLRNRSGRSVDLIDGTVRLGTPQLPDGSACVLDQDNDCSATLAPGATHEGVLRFELRDTEDGAWDFELTVGDNQRYDHGTVSRGGFYEFFQLEESLSLSAGQPFSGGWRRPPVIDVSRAPALVSDDVVLSGMVSDDHNVADVVVYHGDDKVFYRGGGTDVARLPFSVEPELATGTNLLVILARDDQGLTASRSFSVWSPGGTQAISKGVAED